MGGRRGIPSSRTNANTRRGLGRRPSSRCSRENHPDCRLSTSKFKTSDEAVKHSRLKWAKSASVKDALMEPQEVRAHCDPVSSWHQTETEDFWPSLKSQISKTGDVAIIMAMSVYLEFKKQILPHYYLTL